MGAYIISVLSPKGGVGKSTISINLARGLQLAGDGSQVLIVDSDKQGTATEWSTFETGIEFPQVITIASKNMEAGLSRIRDVFDYVIIDGKGNLEATHMVPIIKASDLILIPVGSSGPDVWATEPLVEIIHARREITEGKPDAGFILSKINSQTYIAGDVQEVLDGMGFTTLESQTRILVGYQESVTQGLTVYDHERSMKAREDIQALVDEVLSIKEGSKRLDKPVT